MKMLIILYFPCLIFLQNVIFFQNEQNHPRIVLINALFWHSGERMIEHIIGLLSLQGKDQESFQSLGTLV